MTKEDEAGWQNAFLNWKAVSEEARIPSRAVHYLRLLMPIKL